MLRLVLLISSYQIHVFFWILTFCRAHPEIGIAGIVVWVGWSQLKIWRNGMKGEREGDMKKAGMIMGSQKRLSKENFVAFEYFDWTTLYLIQSCSPQNSLSLENRVRWNCAK